MKRDPSAGKRSAGRNSGVSRIDLMPLGDKRLGKVVSPTGFGAFDLDQGRANGFAGGVRFAALNLINNVRQALVHFLFIAGIAAKEEIIHVEAVQHDLITHGFDGANAIQGQAGILAGRAFPPAGEDIHYEQHGQGGQNQAETRIKFFPIVIAKCLRSPQQDSVEITASAGTTLPQLFP